MAKPGEFVAEYIVPAVDMNALPGGVLGYAEVTSDQGSITTETDLTGLTDTVTAVANRRIEISTKIGVSSSAVSDTTVALRIKEGTTQLGIFQMRPDAANRPVALLGSVIISPPAGEHTYKLTLQRTVGTGTLTLEAASDEPAFILVQDLGPA